MKENTNITEFNSEIEKAFQTAWHSEKGGDDKWNKLLNDYGADSLTHQEKEQLLNSEMKIARGAFPIELRRVYQKISDKNLLKNDPELNEVLKSFDIEGKVKEYTILNQKTDHIELSTEKIMDKNKLAMTSVRLTAVDRCGNESRQPVIAEVIR